MYRAIPLAIFRELDGSAGSCIIGAWLTYPLLRYSGHADRRQMPELRFVEECAR